MNNIEEVKSILERYYDGESTDVDEQRLREYFSSGDVAPELQPYRSIFAYMQQVKEQPVAEECPIVEIKPRYRPIMWYAAAGIAACLLITGLLTLKQEEPIVTSCTGTYVVVNGICYDDLSLVGKHAAEAIDDVTEPIEGNPAIDALDFLDMQ